MTFVHKHSLALQKKRTQRTKNIFLFENFFNEYIFQRYDINNFYFSFKNNQECGLKQFLIENGCGSFYIDFNITNLELNLFENFIYNSKEQLFIVKLIFTILNSTQQNFGNPLVNMFIKLNTTFYIFRAISNELNFEIDNTIFSIIDNFDFNLVINDLNLINNSNFEIENICFNILFKKLEYDYSRDLKLSYNDDYNISIQFLFDNYQSELKF
jgi:hypothetical protein